MRTLKKPRFAESGEFKGRLVHFQVLVPSPSSETWGELKSNELQLDRSALLSR
jgi:hypothetical protein